MELIIAFLIAFGAVNATDAGKLSQADAEKLIVKSDLQKEYVIWDAEADDF